MKQKRVLSLLLCAALLCGLLTACTGTVGSGTASGI